MDKGSRAGAGPLVSRLRIELVVSSSYTHTVDDWPGRRAALPGICAASCMSSACGLIRVMPIHHARGEASPSPRGFIVLGRHPQKQSPRLIRVSPARLTGRHDKTGGCVVCYARDGLNTALYILQPLT